MRRHSTSQCKYRMHVNIIPCKADQFWHTKVNTNLFRGEFNTCHFYVKLSLLRPFTKVAITRGPSLYVTRGLGYSSGEQSSTYFPFRIKWYNYEKSSTNVSVSKVAEERRREKLVTIYIFQSKGISERKKYKFGFATALKVKLQKMTMFIFV